MEKLEHFFRYSPFFQLGGTIKKDITLLVISGIALIVSIFDLVPLPFDASWAAIILCGIPIILEAVIGLVTAFDIKADVLVSLALIASVCIGEDFAAGEVAFIMQLGGLLRRPRPRGHRKARPPDAADRTRHHRRKGNGRPAGAVKVGDLLRVLSGETIPVDGEIVSGQTSVNQAVMTGESLPVDKGVGEGPPAQSTSSFEMIMRGVHPAHDLVQSRPKSSVLPTAGRMDRRHCPTAAALTWLISGEIIRAVIWSSSAAGNADCHHGRHRQRDGTSARATPSSAVKKGNATRLVHSRRE